MDMSPESADPSIANLPLTDPRCINESCTAFYAAENASQAATPWAGQFEYGHWVTWYYLTIIGVLLLVHAHRLYSARRAITTSEQSSSPSLRQKLLAVARYFSYHRITLRPFDRLGLPPTGMFAFLLVTTLFLCLLTFVATPYYRAHLGYGSPPIAIRAGLMAFACTPPMVALAGKANIVTLLTGISHEKLNVVHRWVAWMALALSIVHTAPFFVASAWDGGFENVKAQFYGVGSSSGMSMEVSAKTKLDQKLSADLDTQLTGVPPLAVLCGLVAFSIPTIRRRCYGLFQYTHILLAVTYLGCLFWHSDNTLDSWAYLWAALAVWLASWLARVFWFWQPMRVGADRWLDGAPTNVVLLPGDMVKVDVLAPYWFEHTPAQHCFLRFPNVHILESHPFTISSMSRAREDDKVEEQQVLTFLIRARDGFTKKLFAYTATQPDRQVETWIDGPYGGLHRSIENEFDTLILMAGGGGISACLPWLLHVCRQCGSGKRRMSKVVLVWVMKEAEHFCWARHELEALARDQGRSINVVLEFHVTQESHVNAVREKETPAITKQTTEIASHSVSSSSEHSRLELEPEPLQHPPGNNKDLSSVDAYPASSSPMARLGNVVYGHPQVGAQLEQYVGPGKTIVVGCGPESFSTDIGNACAVLQRRVLRGDAEAVSLHLEAFEY